MIRFFRTIRQRMLSKNRFTRYMVYATGEIVLVVIGILVALQVNNWNADRKAQAEEREYMNALLDESKPNAWMLEGLASSNRAALRAANLLLAELERLPGVSNMDALHAALAKPMTIGTTVLISSIYQEMGSSGNLKLLRSDAVRRAIVYLYASVDLVYKIEEIGVTEQWKDLYTPFVNKHVDQNRILSLWVPHSQTGAYDTELPALPFWNLAPTVPLKVELGDLLATYYAGVCWVAGQQEKLMAGSMNIQRLLSKYLGNATDIPAQPALSPFER